MNFDRNDTYNKIATLVGQELKIEPTSIKPNSTFKDLGADSLDMVQIIVKLEEQFGIEIKDEDAEKMEIFDDAVSYVQERRTK